MLADLRLRLLYGVFDSPIESLLGVEVEKEPRGAGVSIARLADRAGIEKPAFAGQVDLSALLTKRQRELLRAEAKRDVAVPDEDERLLGRLERQERDLGRKHVLPDRVARARVEELRAVVHG